MQILPTKSTWLHMRFFFSFFLLPVYVFALSQSPQFSLVNAALVFICWHLFIYPASNGYNSYFDKDEGSIALLEKPPVVDKSLYWCSLLFDLLGFLLGLAVSLEFALALLVYGALSKLYSHPAIRLKKNPYASFLVVFLFQGAFVYWASLAAISGKSITASWNVNYVLAGLICSCLVGASYPLTQVYQHDEDRKRGDRTLSLLLGINGSFIFSAALFLVGLILTFAYWHQLRQISHFWIFVLFILPVMLTFLSWFLGVLKDKSKANFRNMSRMTLISGTAMLLYFLLLLLKKLFLF